MAAFSSLSEWLAWQETLHPNPIDLGLTRIDAVLQRLHWKPLACPVFTLSGTKGKGSCAALLESLLAAAGHRVGLLTSPHLRRYTERMRIAGEEISAAALCEIFERIDRARGEISLTYFEFNTLAALLAFASAKLDAVILEVGMGGRLDAVNVIDADVALVTSVGLDHCEWLGYDVESIGREKAGIFRARRPAIFGAVDMPQSVAEHATELGAPLLRFDRDFGCEIQGDRWNWWFGEERHNDLPRPALQGQVQIHNAAAALTALSCVADRLLVTREAIEIGLRAVKLDGRFQIVPGEVEWVLDVAHNPLSAQTLADNLADCLPRRRTIAVFGGLADKDLSAMAAILKTQVDEWVIADLPSLRAVPAMTLAATLRNLGVSVAAAASSVAEACAVARAKAVSGDRVLVFGSFLTVGPALDWLGL